jgi:ribokinase
MSREGARPPRMAVVGHVEFVDFLAVERLPESSQVIAATGAFARAAGGGSVAAAVLAELGAEVDFFCALGDDELGDRAEEELRARGIRVHAARRRAPTRRAFTMLQRGGGRAIVTVGERLEPSGRDQLPWDRLDGAAGTFFTAGDPGALAHGRRSRVLVATPRARYVLEHGPRLDALVYSRGDRDESAWAERFAGHARLVLATEGARGGAWWGESRGRWSAAPLPGPESDDYGCGDSFVAGLTFGLATGAPIADAAALGARWGARCLTRPGAP